MKFFYCFLIVLACFGCSKNSNTQFLSWIEDNGKVKVLSTTAMIDDLVGEIGKDRVDHIPLIQGEIDPHMYELVKGDDEKISFAHIFIGNGLNLEHGASLRYHFQKHPHVVFLGDEIKKRVPDRIMMVDGELDPHVWMDISLWVEGIDPIVSALSRQDPEYAQMYKQNGDLLRQKMLCAHEEIKKSLQSVADEKRYLVTSHDAFHYFARAYLFEENSWEKRCMAPQGLAPEGQISSGDIQRVMDHLCEYRIEVVFPNPT